MKKSPTWSITGCILIIATMLLTACAAGPGGETPTPAGGTEGPSAYPFPYPYPEPGNDPSTAYPALPPDTSVTAGPAGGDTPQPYPPADGELFPYAPQAGDASLNRGEVFVEQTDVLTMESFPPQFALTLAGSLPTPCHQLRVDIAPPNNDDEIEVTVYSVVDGNAICTQVLKPFEARVPLENLPSGAYTVLVNGEAAGEIDVP